jgi:uncharacterized protein YjbI with pentapeptide repeats
MMRQMFIVAAGTSLGTGITGCALASAYVVTRNNVEANRNLRAVDFADRFLCVRQQRHGDAVLDGAVLDGAVLDGAVLAISNELKTIKQTQLKWLSLPIYQKIRSPPPSLLEALAQSQIWYHLRRLVEEESK